MLNGEKWTRTERVFACNNERIMISKNVENALAKKSRDSSFIRQKAKLEDVLKMHKNDA